MITIEELQITDITFDTQNRAVISNEKINKKIAEALGIFGTNELKLSIKDVKISLGGITIEM